MKYVVRMAVDGRVDVEVEASSPEEAFKVAKFKDADMSAMDVIGMVPVNCTDEDGNIVDA